MGDYNKFESMKSLCVCVCGREGGGGGGGGVADMLKCHDAVVWSTD